MLRDAGVVNVDGMVLILCASSLPAQDLPLVLPWSSVYVSVNKIICNEYNDVRIPAQTAGTFVTTSTTPTSFSLELDKCIHCLLLHSRLAASSPHAIRIGRGGIETVRELQVVEARWRFLCGGGFGI